VFEGVYGASQVLHLSFLGGSLLWRHHASFSNADFARPSQLRGRAGQESYLELLGGVCGVVGNKKGLYLQLSSVRPGSLGVLDG
jgi:hypothetical protein